MSTISWLTVRLFPGGRNASFRLARRVYTVVLATVVISVDVDQYIDGVQDCRGIRSSLASSGVVVSIHIYKEVVQVVVVTFRASW